MAPVASGSVPGNDSETRCISGYIIGKEFCDHGIRKTEESKMRTFVILTVVVACAILDIEGRRRGGGGRWPGRFLQGFGTCHPNKTVCDADTFTKDEVTKLIPRLIPIFANQTISNSVPASQTCSQLCTCLTCGFGGCLPKRIKRRRQPPTSCSQCMCFPRIQMVPFLIDMITTGQFCMKC